MTFSSAILRRSDGTAWAASDSITDVPNGERSLIGMCCTLASGIAAVEPTLGGVTIERPGYASSTMRLADLVLAAQDAGSLAPKPVITPKSDEGWGEGGAVDPSLNRVRRFAIQGHAVPDRAYYPGPIFDPVVLAEPERTAESGPPVRCPDCDWTGTFSEYLHHNYCVEEEG
jgi:hypothetical protein